MNNQSDLQNGNPKMNTRKCLKYIHDNENGERNEIVCPLCDYVAKSRMKLKRHFYIHSGMDVFSCAICDYVAIRKDNLDNHMFARHFKCTKCDFIGINKSILKIHFKDHTKENQFHCAKCDFTCSRNSGFRIHMRYKHKNTYGCQCSFKCTVCDYFGNTKDELDWHFLKHRIKNEFNCTKCEYKSFISEHLKAHFVLTHAEEKQLECTKCDFNSSDILSYKSQMMKKQKDNTGNLGIVSGRNKNYPLKNTSIFLIYKCTNCNDEFSDKDELKSHMPVHLGEEPYVCYLCGFGTKYRYSLESHFLIHTGENNFCCTLCNFKSISRDQIEKHMCYVGKYNPLVEIHRSTYTGEKQL